MEDYHDWHLCFLLVYLSFSCVHCFSWKLFGYSLWYLDLFMKLMMVYCFWFMIAMIILHASKLLRSPISWRTVCVSFYLSMFLSSRLNSVSPCCWIVTLTYCGGRLSDYLQYKIGSCPLATIASTRIESDCWVLALVSLHQTCLCCSFPCRGHCEFMLTEMRLLRTKSWQRTDSFCHEAFLSFILASKRFNRGGFLTLD